jgi:hypothetical protein
VAHLVAAKQLAQRTGASGSVSLKVSRRGHARLRSHNIGAWEGYDLGCEEMMQFVERCFATNYLIGREHLGYHSFGVHALTTGLAPISQEQLRESLGMAPDGLVVGPGYERGYDTHVLAADWVQVLIRDKPQTEYDRLFAVARTVSWLDAREIMRLDRMVLLVDANMPTEKAVIDALRHHLATHPAVGGSPLRLAIVRCEVGFPLVWKGCEEVDCVHMLKERDSNSQ